jgi:ubiquinone/menaquinone biosynthesis C-methylase UbiE
MNAWSKKRDVMRRYDATAQIYDVRYAEEQTAKIEAALRHVNADISIVLDAGCGTGILFSHIADKALMTVGLDSSRRTLLKARERTKNYAGVHLLLADADNMPLKGGIFDVVLAVTLIQNIPNPAQTLNEIKRVASGKSLIVVTGLKKVFKRSSLERLLKDAGLSIVAMESEGLKCYVAVCAQA